MVPINSVMGIPHFQLVLLWTFASFLVCVVDGNSAPIIFNLPSTLSLREDEEVGKRSIFAIFAFDSDPVTSPAGRIHYLLTPIDHTDFKFSVDAAIGDMYLVQKLDYETKNSYVLTAEVADLGTPPKSVRAKLTIKILDVNDNSPECRAPNVIGSLKEDATMGTSITELECTDPDTGNGGIVDFEIVGGDSDVIEVDGTGKATLKRMVDYDTEKATFEVDVKVKDRGTPQLFSMAKVILSLEDIDDLRPAFAKPAGYTGNVKENTPLGNTILVIDASDGDAPNTDASLLRFGLETTPVPDWINVDPFTGSLVVKRNIDWELEQVIECDVYVHSSDHYDIRSVVHVTITIDDVNDGIPTFDQVYYEVSVNESTPIHTTVAVINATDLDDGPDGEITYSIEESSIFHIDNVTGVLSLNASADYEDRQSYLITVVAKDGGDPATSSSVFVQVTVFPENEYPPVFVAPFTFDVSEDLAPGSSVFTVITQDGDEGLDGLIGYRVITNDVPFLIDAGTGVIRVAYDLDFETTTAYNVTVEAVDNSTTFQRSVQQMFMVSILDANDVAAVCEYVPTLVIKYPFLIGPMITTVVCTDLDTDASALSFNVSSGNDGTFTVANDGQLSLTSPPLKNRYDLTVEVDDGGGQITPVSFIVFAETVLDFRNLPEVVVVKESNSLATPALDTQLGYAFPPVSAKFVKGNDNHQLVLTPKSAKLFFALDYDRDVQENNTYTVEALSVSGQNATKTFTVQVEDTNDNAPTFQNTAYLLKLSEILPVTSTVFLFSATDTDAESNAELNYSIPFGNEDGTFAINATGMLTLVLPLHYETKSTYVLEITASDSGIPSLTGTTTAVINVMNVKEDDPSIIPVSGDNEVEILEDAALGSILFELTIPPSDVPNPVEFEIESGNEDDSFGVESTSGKIYLTKMLDREIRSSFSLWMSAVNRNGTKIYGTLNITVGDINDNCPVFSKTVYVFNVPHLEGTGTKIGEVHVTDDDVGENSNITLSIINGNTGSAFVFFGNDLLTATEMDYHAVASYNLIVMATDRGIPALSSHTAIHIDVIPIVTLPRFTAPTVTVNVSESIHIGSRVIDVDATALGASETDNSMRYEIKSGDHNNHFNLDTSSGILTLVKELDYETDTSHILVIAAINKVDALQRDEMTLVIEVENVNEFAPYFDRPSYHWTVSESVGATTSVGTVTVVDDDGDAFGEFETTASGSSDFAIESSTGIVKVTRSLDFLRQSLYTLILTTRDNGVPSKSSVASLTIEIIDENNHAPTFSPSNYVTQIYSLITLASEVFHFYAPDLDTGVYGDVIYTITSDSSSGTFVLDSASGILTLAKQPDVTKYTLVVKAEDGGTPPRESTATLEITVFPGYGDNTAPSFTAGPAFIVSVPRNSAPNYEISVVEATDMDPGEYGNLSYYISSGNDDGFFLIDEENGKLTTASWLYTAQNSYSLVITAVDGGKPAKSDSITATIDINPPRTTSTKIDYSFTASEDLLPGNEVGRILVDAGRTASNYAIDSGNIGNVFTIVTDVSGEGIVRTVGNLDFEEFSLYSLLVTVSTDIGDLTKIVEVIVTDLNDEPPQFLTSSLSLPLAENMPVGHTLTTLSYEDKDHFKANRAVTFALTNNAAPYLDIDQSGHVSLLQSPDFETVQQLKATVTISQSSFPPASLSITVDVFDVEETQVVTKPPSSRAIFISLELPHQVDKNYLVHTLSVANFGINSSTTAEFLSFDVAPPFEVDQTSGELTVTNADALQADTSYHRWVVCRTSTESVMALFRLDAFDRDKYMIIIEFGESMATVKANQERFITRVQVFFTGNQRVGLSFVFEESPLPSRRRLLATSTPVALYVVEDDLVDGMDHVDSQKQFLTQAEILQNLQQSDDGTPVSGLSDPSFLTVNKVVAYVSSDGSGEPFLTSTEGIIMLTFLALLTVVVVACVVAYWCYRKKKNGASISKERMDDTDPLPLHLSPTSSISSHDGHDRPHDNDHAPSPNKDTEIVSRTPINLEGVANPAFCETEDETNKSESNTLREKSEIGNSDMTREKSGHAIRTSLQSSESDDTPQTNALSVLPTDDGDEVMERVVVPIRRGSHKGGYI